MFVFAENIEGRALPRLLPLCGGGALDASTNAVEQCPLSRRFVAVSGDGDVYF